MDVKQLEELEFIAFEFDFVTLYAKEFPSIGYSLCTSGDNTFSISTYPGGDVLARVDVEHILSMHNAIQKADQEINSFKSAFDMQIKKLFNLNTEGDTN